MLTGGLKGGRGAREIKPGKMKNYCLKDTQRGGRFLLKCSNRKELEWLPRNPVHKLAGNRPAN